MTETLTESFCERCGTRYEFKAPTRLNPLRKTKGFIGGLKNWVTSQDDMSDAMRDAMRMEEDALASAQLEAFHQSFNFCIDCRQYTCVNCWNDGAGRCRSCAPIPGTDDLAERLAASMAADGARAVAEPIPVPSEPQYDFAPDAWPSSDLPMEPVGGHHADVAWPDADTASTAPEPEPEPVVVEAEPEPEPEPVVAGAEVEAEPEPVVAEAEVEPEPERVLAAAEVEPEPEPVVAGAEVEAEPEPVAADVVEEARPPLRVLAWEPDGAYELFDEVGPEPEPVAAEVEAEPEPVAAEVEAEPEPVAAEVQAEPEPVAERPRIAPISETILRFPRHDVPAPTEPERQVAAEESPEVAARRAQLDLLGLGGVDEGPAEPDRPAVLPYRSRGAAPRAGEIGARGGGFWEASAREVAGAASTTGVQNCGQCGLSLSANARFCRRCGTRQAQSA